MEKVDSGLHYSDGKLVGIDSYHAIENKFVLVEFNPNVDFRMRKVYSMEERYSPLLDMSYYDFEEDAALLGYHIYVIFDRPGKPFKGFDIYIEDSSNDDEDPGLVRIAKYRRYDLAIKKVREDCHV